jgi:hypothetical protein
MGLFVNLYKRPSELFQRVQDIFHEQGEKAVDRYVAALSLEEQKALIKETIELGASLPLIAIMLDNANFSTS